MPRSHGVLKVTVWEVGSDFRTLELDPQWAYSMLISQPQINNLGLLPYTPEKWWRFAADLTADRLSRALAALERARMTVTDLDTGELLVRTFIKHDQVWKQPKLVTNARKLIREVESQRIRDYLLGRHPWLLDDGWTAAQILKHETPKRGSRQADRKPLSTEESPPETEGVWEGVTEPLTEDLSEGVSEPLSEGVSPPRARVRDGLPLPLDQPLPLDRDVTKAVGLNQSTATAQDRTHEMQTPNLLREMP